MKYAMEEEVVNFLKKESDVKCNAVALRLESQHWLNEPDAKFTIDMLLFGKEHIGLSTVSNLRQYARKDFARRTLCCYYQMTEDMSSRRKSKYSFGKTPKGIRGLEMEDDNLLCMEMNREDCRQYFIQVGCIYLNNRPLVWLL